jgi:mannose-6-phosphate isomerase-like protein (cupin superfamily)
MMMRDRIQLSQWQTLDVIDRGPAALVLESAWTTGGPPPPAHWHPHQREEFEILEGELTVQRDDAAPTVLTAGQRLVVEPRQVHRMWNASDRIVRASWRIEPARRTLEMLRQMEAGTGGLRGPRLLWTFRQEMRIPIKALLAKK